MSLVRLYKITRLTLRKNNDKSVGRDSHAPLVYLQLIFRLLSVYNKTLVTKLTDTSICAFRYREKQL